MKNFIIVGIIFLLTIPLKAQPSITETVSLFPLSTAIAKKIVANNTEFEYGSSNIGKEKTASTIYIYRTYFYVDLSTIPTNASIQEVKLTYSTDYKGYTFKFTNISSLGSTLESKWNAIGNGSTLHSGIGYGSGTITSAPIKSQMQNSLSNRFMMIGGVGENETSDDSYSALSIQLEIKYTRPAVLLSLQARNDLQGADGGTIGVAIYPNAPVPQSSPFQFSAYETQKINLEAYDNQYVSSTGYTWIFNNNEAPLNKSKWYKDKFGDIKELGGSQSITTDPLTANDNGASFVAYLKKICNVTFQNNFVGAGNGGTIKVNGTQYNSPTSQFQVIEGNTITAEAQSYYFMNGIEYTFTNWSDGSTSWSKTFTINNHNQITANYRGKPTNNGEYIHFGSQVGEPIEIYWSDNPNPNVTQYQIWRKVKHNGVVGPERLIGTVGRGVGRFVDYDYVLTSSYTDDLLMYDVRAYYSVEGTYSDPNYVTVYGAESLYKKGEETKPVEYSIEVYPNPFNPSTTINYQLPERSLVAIKIYDMLGREIKELINEIKEAGYYKLEFDGNELSSGIYICTINANKFSKSIKLMLVK